MDQRQQQLKKRIMRRVYMLYGIRLFVHPRTLKSFILTLLLWRSTSYVSYVDVFNNIPGSTDITRDLLFAHSAIMRTELMTIVLMLAMVAFGIWLARDFVRRTA